jgi:hypothetical protein
VVNNNNLNMDAGPSAHSNPTLKLVAGGGLELRVKASLAVTYQPNNPGSDPKTTWVEAQPLSSEASLAGVFIGYTLVGGSHTTQVDTSQENMSLDVACILTREQVLQVEHARQGRALEFTTKLQVLVRSREQGQTWPFDLKWRIAASDWLEMLAQIGFFRTIQVVLPFPAETLPTKNALLLSELQKVEQLVRSGNHSSAIAVMRDVWDPLMKEYVPDGRWDPIIAKALPATMASAVSDYATRLRALVNKGHHRGAESPSGGSGLYDFTEADAEFVLQTALVFLRYMGRLATERLSAER